MRREIERDLMMCDAQNSHIDLEILHTVFVQINNLRAIFGLRMSQKGLELHVYNMHHTQLVNSGPVVAIGKSTLEGGPSTRDSFIVCIVSGFEVA